MYIFKIYSSSTIHQTTTFNLKCIFVHSHAHPLSKNWVSQHIFKKQIPTWRKWPQFESCQMYIFKIYSSSTIHQTTSFNLKCIFVHSHAHPLSKNWLSQHIFKKQIPNWRKWPQFESCQMYIFKIYSSSTIHQTTTFNLKCIFVHSHAHPLSKNWVSQHIFKKQIPTWRKWPQFESCQMYIFKIYSSSTIHQTTSFNLKCIFVHSHAHPLSQNWLSQHIFKKQIPNWGKWPQFDSYQLYIFKIYSSSTYTRQQPSTSNAYLSTPMHTLWAKIGWVSIFLKNRFQIDANDLNLRVAKCIFSKSTPHQQYTRQQPSTSNAYLSTPMHTLWAKIGWVRFHIFKKQIPTWRKWPQFESCQMSILKIYSSSTIHQTTSFNLKCIFVHSHAHPLSKNWLSQHIFKKQIPNWGKWPQFESYQMYIFKIYSSSTIHQTTTFNLKCIFVHSHAHPLSKNWLSQHIFKKQIPNWRKWHQFESCQMYIFKIYSSSTTHQTTTFNLKSIFVHSHAHPLSKNWMSRHIFEKLIPNWRKWPQFESYQMYIFKIYSSSTIHQTTTFNLKCIFVHSHAHPLSKNWLNQHIFKKQIPNWRKWPQFESCQMYIFKIYSSSTIHQATTFNLKCIFVHSHAHPLSKNWVSQHIFKKQIPNWRKWPQFESCQMYIFKIYSSSTIHQTTSFNLKCIFVHSHAHPLSKNWLSQHIFKKQIPNWGKWPQFDSYQLYIFKIYSSSTLHQTTTFNLKCIFVHSHAHPLSKNWLSQYIFKNHIPNWRKWPQFESSQMYIFKIYSSSTTHQTTTFNLKCIFVHSHAHPLSKNWVSQHIFKKQIPNWRKWPQFESCQMYIFKIYSSSTIHQATTFNLKCIFVHSHAHPLSKNWLSQHIFKKLIPNWRKWPQFESYQMYIFKIYSSSTIHQTTTFNLKCIFVHSHAHPLSKNWLSQHIFKKLIPNWRKWPQFESCQMYIFKIYYSSTIHQTTTFNLKCIFLHSHAQPLSKNSLSQHIFKKLIPNWRKWPQFESYQMYIFKMYSSSTIHQKTSFNLKCIFIHSHAHPLSKNWLSQHIFKKQILNWRKWPQFESCQMYIFKIYSSSTLHRTTTFNLKCIFVHSHAHPLSKNWLRQYIFKNQIPNWRKLPQFKSCQMYIFKIYCSSTTHQTTTFNLKSIFVHAHAHRLSKNWVNQHIFKKQIPTWRKWPQFESCQMSILKIYSSSTIHQTTSINLKCIFVHSHAHPLSKNWLSQHIFKKQIPNWRKWPQFESCQMYILKIYYSSTIHQTTTFNLKCIFLHSHAQPLSKNSLSQHIFKKLIPNWRKWPQFESYQMYIFKIYSSSTIHQKTSFNLKCIFIHSHAHPLSKNWLSQHIFKKQILNWRKWPQFESCQMYIFKIYSSSTLHRTTTFNLKCIFVHSHAHPLSKNWLRQYIFKNQIPNWRKLPQFKSCQMYIFKIYCSSTTHQTTTFNLKSIFVHAHAHRLSKNWVNQHIFKKQIPTWRKWPQFESCQMSILKIYSSSTIHQTTSINLKCIFVHSHAHPLSKNWLSQHIFKKQIPNWRKWPQFESCQMYILKIYYSSTIHQTTTFTLKCIFIHSHAQPLSKNSLSQHIFKKQIPNWRKWPQFESCQMYIFKIYSSSTIHQTTTFNLKSIFVHSHAHPLSKNWLSQHIFKKQIPNWRKWPQFESCQMYIFKIYSSSTTHQTTTFNLKSIFVHFPCTPFEQKLAESAYF